MDAIVRPRAEVVREGRFCGGGLPTREEYYQRAGVDYRLCEEACVVAVSAARHEAEVHSCWSALGPAQLWASDCRGV